MIFNSLNDEGNIYYGAAFTPVSSALFIALVDIRRGSMGHATLRLIHNAWLVASIDTQENGASTI